MLPGPAADPCGSGANTPNGGYRISWKMQLLDVGCVNWETVETVVKSNYTVLAPWRLPVRWAHLCQQQ